MSDALPLTARLNLEQYNKLAEGLEEASQSTDPNAIRNWAARWPSPDAERLARGWRKYHQEKPCKLADAQFFVARCHGFASWPQFSSHVLALDLANSPVSNFEAAADAIVNGDATTLRTLLKDHPSLVRSRSTREHRSTLLHYVSANGIEDFRQKTPKNIVEIAKLLLDAGAEVNAESDAYGGRSTTLGLTATSVHPEAAGLQIELLELLIDHGAIIDGPDQGSAVLGCLANGRGQAAEFLAGRGALLDLESAAGVGRLDLVQRFFDETGPTQSALAWACQFGHAEIVEFLLQKGVNFRDKHKGESPLHWAAFGAHASIVKMLLDRGAPVDIKDDNHQGTPLGWAQYGNQSTSDQAKRQAYAEVFALLARA